MKMLLTGGAGYVGSACLRYLIRNGHDPIAFDDLSEGNRDAVPADRLVVGDILNKDALVDAMKTHEVEAVMHFAAVASVPESVKDPDLYWKVNVIGTKNVLDAMRETGVDRIVFSSTAATFGFHDEMPITEAFDQRPETPYGSTKLADEWMIREYAKAYGIGYAFLRYFNASGADEDGENGEDRRHESHLIPLILYTALGRRDSLKIFGDKWETRDGTCVRDYIHVEDLAQAHQLCVENIEPGVGRDYCMGNGEGTTVLEVLRAAEKVVGRDIPHEFADARPGDPAVLIATPEKITRELGWKPKYTDIEDIIRTAWAWHERYPQGYDSKRAGG
ncbi:MAG: UDP-glucose 4-epimerase GalE [Phycisphaerales bacterium]